MDQRWLLATAWSGLLLPLATLAHAAEPEQPSEEASDSDRRTRWVDFQAGRVDVDGELKELELSDDVVVRVDRYRLTSERLRLRRGPSGIVVDGSGRVAFCPCPDPPVTIGFESVTVAPPTDLLIEQPTLRVGCVPVLWFPYLWLRSADRTGLLPPHVAWRGEDGLLVGSGVHMPVGPRDAAGRRWSLDVAPAAYLQGGVVVESRLSTPHTSTRVRWDYLRESLLAIDARGASARDDEAATAAWSVDAIRGERGRQGTLSVEEASRRYDRAELSVGHYGGAVVGGVGLRADSWRADSMQRAGSVGPRAHVGYGSALDSAGTVDASLAVSTVRDPDFGAGSLAVHRRSITLEARPGPFALGMDLRQQLAATSQELDEGAAVWTHGRASVALPLVRAYGSGSDPLRHWVEPFARFGAGHAHQSGALVDPAWPRESEFVSAVAGTKTSLGRYGSRGAGSLSLSGGWIGTAQQLSAALSGRASVRAYEVAVRADALWLPPRRDALVSLLRARLGPLDSPHLSGYAEGRFDVDATAARWLSPDAPYAPRGDWFDRDGWTVGSTLALPWAKWLASSVSADHDLTAERWLAVRGSLGYRHPCGCLAAVAWAGHRLGRRGIDASVSVDLMP